MKLFRRSSKINDERIASIINRIYKEAYFLAMTISLLSIGVKFYLYGPNIKFVYTEFLIIFIPAIYYWIRSLQLGIYSDEIEVHDRTSKIPRSAKNIIIGLVMGVGISLFFGLRSSIVYGNDSNRIWYFILVFVASFIIYVPFFVIGIVSKDFISRKVSKKVIPEEDDDNEL